MSFHSLDAECGHDIGKLGETVILEAFVEDDRRQTPSAGSKYLITNHSTNRQAIILPMKVLYIKKLHPASGPKWTAPALTLAAHAGRLLEPLGHWVFRGFGPVSVRS